MSEEQNVETNDGTWSGLKKTIIGVISTAVLAGGTYLTTHLFGGGEEHKAEPAPVAAPVINLNVDNSSKNTATGGGTTTIIKEKTVEKSAPQETKKAEPKKEFSEEPKW